jgi:energy-converting hydrogenase Eha subunit G
MSKSIRPETTTFLAILGITVVVWVLRGFGLLTFLPGGIIWLLIFLTVGAGIYSVFQGMRR